LFSCGEFVTSLQKRPVWLVMKSSRHIAFFSLFLMAVLFFFPFFHEERNVEWFAQFHHSPAKIITGTELKRKHFVVRSQEACSCGTYKVTRRAGSNPGVWLT
jgi:hypothetical protein